MNQDISSYQRRTQIVTTLLILLPNSGSIQTPCFEAIIGLTQALQRKKIPFAIKTYSFSDIVMSRNYLMSFFLKQKKFTHALLLDSDISFAPDLVFKHLEFDVAFTCAPYPKRSISFEKFRRFVEREMTASNPAATRDIVAKTLEYIVQEALNKDEQWIPRVRGDFKTIPGAGTGLMLLAREVPERLALSGVAQSYPRQSRLPIYADSDFHDFFSHLTTAEGEAMLGEDTSFCNRWVSGCGGDIWMDTKAKVTHTGSINFHGNYDALDQN